MQGPHYVMRVTILGNEGYLCREVAVRVETQHVLNDTSHE